MPRANRHHIPGQDVSLVRPRMLNECFEAFRKRFERVRFGGKFCNHTFDHFREGTYNQSVVFQTGEGL